MSFVMEANMILMTGAMITAIGPDRVWVILVIGPVIRFRHMPSELVSLLGRGVILRYGMSAVMTTGGYKGQSGRGTI